MRILVVNPGSSSLKLRFLGDGDEVLADEELPAPEGEVEAPALEKFVAGLGAVDAVGYRVVHGGDRFTAAAELDDAAIAYLRTLVPLAPLHQRAALAAVAAGRRLLPGARHAGVFDTAFHATLPPAARTYAIPARWRDEWGVRRYGFHGLSHAYASQRAGAPRCVTCHLGSGASLAAVLDGRSVDTTMGFTPLEGLVMGTRSGSIDPGVIPWVQQQRGLDAAAVLEALERESGLKALAGTPDMKAVVERATAGDGGATLALDVYTHRLRGAVAAMAASLGGLDALVFTGGVGERSSDVRSRAAAGLGFLGVQLDEARNRAVDGDGEIQREGAPVRVLVVEAREDLEVARQVRAL